MIDMEQKKYAPLIGKTLTWEIIQRLINDIRFEVRAEEMKAKKKDFPILKKNVGVGDSDGA